MILLSMATSRDLQHRDLIIYLVLNEKGCQAKKPVQYEGIVHILYLSLRGFGVTINLYKLDVLYLSLRGFGVTINLYKLDVLYLSLRGFGCHHQSVQTWRFIPVSQRVWVSPSICTNLTFYTCLSEGLGVTINLYKLDVLYLSLRGFGCHHQSVQTWRFIPVSQRVWVSPSICTNLTFYTCLSEGLASPSICTNLTFYTCLSEGLGVTINLYKLDVLYLSLRGFGITINLYKLDVLYLSLGGFGVTINLYKLDLSLRGFGCHH